MTKSKLNIITATAVTLGLSLALVTAPVSARGPKASVNSATTCALDLGADGSGVANLVITTTLTNKSSGGTVAELRDGSQIQGTFKKQEHGNGNLFFNLNGAVPIEGLPEDVNPDLQVSATYGLCGEPEADNVAIARELNGTATMMYGIYGGSETVRKVENRCTDDPDTDDDEGGIRVDDAIFLAIAVACDWD